MTREEWKKKAQDLVECYLDRDDEDHISTEGGDDVPDNCADEILEIIEALLRYRFDWGYKDRCCPVDYRVVNIKKYEWLDDPILKPEFIESSIKRTNYEIGNILEVVSKSERMLTMLRHRLYDESEKDDR